ncbi:hypothetical protein D9613_012352 [Agrocybe pediades]|uniref:Oxidoreductase AflY n=1 Tax=Agrocybe pediades TaxID=84607 RepID=A0A8H4QEW4_9AGAR|nr:hypothetical protein D9613_012352 [Agrocybe pediades]
MNDVDNELFPAPSPQGSTKNALGPQPWPGNTSSSTEALREILCDNHKRWHIFFNDLKFHNHAAHAVLSLWSLGADENMLRKSYKESCEEQRPSFPSPQPITRDNWTEHLGDGDYYQGYLNFFKEELRQYKFDYGRLLEEYVFSSRANYSSKASTKDGSQPLMLNRFLAGVIHAFIHTGLGLEFGLPGIFIEGLSLCAVSTADAPQLFPSDMFEDEDSVSSGLVNRLTAAVGLTDPPSPNGKAKYNGMHAFEVIGRVLSDSALAPFKPKDSSNTYQDAIESHGEGIRRCVDQWDIGDGTDLEKKLEELIWSAVLLYGVGGSQKDKEFNADFFFMHFVTSSIFLPTVFSTLRNKSSQIELLKGYLATILSWYIAQGRPSLDLRRFFSDPTTVVPSPPEPVPSYHGVKQPNPWLTIIQATVSHPDDHMPKLLRALANHAVHLGSTPRGAFALVKDLEGVEEIDGTLFLRAAVLTMNKVGWVVGELPLGGVWDRDGFF